MSDKQKIAFITCVNDEMEYEECRYYIERLNVPDQYSVDIISIREAPFMTAGYNCAMRDSDAKYKVYLHQDVFIKEKDFISHILEIFSHDEQIGMLGVVGKKEIGLTVFDMMKWDIGGVADCNGIIDWERPRGSIYAEVVDGLYTEAATADGLLLATQYDIPWREDVFSRWDFYDISQCVEFKKAGYKVVVPYQEKIWCCHVDVLSGLAEYCDQYDLFFREYHEILGISAERCQDELAKADEYKRHAQKVRQVKACIEQLFAMGEKKDLRAAFQNSAIQDSPYLIEYRTIVSIDQTEEKNGEVQLFWKEGMLLSQLIQKLRKLKYVLKRIEYEVYEEEATELKRQYSKYAIMTVCSVYVTDQERVYETLGIKSQERGYG